MSRICGPLLVHYAKLIEDRNGGIRTIVARFVYTAVKVVAHLLSIDEACKKTAELCFSTDAREADLLHDGRVIAVANRDLEFGPIENTVQSFGFVFYDFSSLLENLLAYILPRASSLCADMSRAFGFADRCGLLGDYELELTAFSSTRNPLIGSTFSSSTGLGIHLNPTLSLLFFE